MSACFHASVNFLSFGTQFAIFVSPLICVVGKLLVLSSGSVAFFLLIVLITSATSRGWLVLENHLRVGVVFFLLLCLLFLPGPCHHLKRCFL